MSENISTRELKGEPIEYNPTAQPESSKIPDGTYLMELSLGKNGITGFVANGKVQVKAHVEGRIISPGDRYDGWRASGYLTSMQFKDGTSPLQQMLFHAGCVASATTDVELADLVRQTLDGSPQLRAKLRWETKSVKDDKGNWQQVRGMKKFPQRADGSYDPFVVVAGEELEAYPTIYGFAAAPAAQGA